MEYERILCQVAAVRSVAERDRWVAGTRTVAGILANEFCQRHSISTRATSALDREVDPDDADLCGHERGVSHSDDEDKCRERDLVAEHCTGLDLLGRRSCAWRRCASSRLVAAWLCVGRRRADLVLRATGPVGRRDDVRVVGRADLCRRRDLAALAAR